MINGNILIIDDNEGVLSTLEVLLQFKYKQVEKISNPNLIPSYKKMSETDVVLLDMNFSAGVNTGNEGLYWLREIKKMSPHTAVIMMTAYGDVDLAVKALKEGASDFILKPWNNDKLLATIKSTYALRRSLIQVKKLKKKEISLKEVLNRHDYSIIGESARLKQALSLIHKVAKAEVDVLITGENGTGKQLFAHELHAKSHRSNEIFVGVDMGSIAESLFESELFGHMKGSFTDAKEDRVGKFEAAEGGTLFLDEIGNLSLQMQAKLLSVIQNREIVRVGSNKPIPINIRLIYATNSNLEEMVAQGSFRQDLLYRINTIHIQVPPLREREKDVIALAEFFLKKMGKKYGKSHLVFSQEAKAKLLKYHWPGNIRELQHTIERSIILSEDNALGPEDFLLKPSLSSSPDMENITLEEMESVMIINTLRKFEGNHTAAAEHLGISRQTLYNKLKKMDTNG
ncbi:MAG: sigma-54 dependent transcriptional regulator [Bacteroidota bacterium]